MGVRSCLTLAIMLLAMSLAASAAGSPVPKPIPREIGRNVWLIPAVPLKDREPDGNSVVFEVPAGLVVLDTGRHDWHRQAIVDFAHRRHKAIVAIVNSHWHLDHVSGNPAIRAAFPRLQVYASGAIDAALTGFLAANAKTAEKYLDDTTLPEGTRADLRADRVTTAHGAALKPDIAIKSSASLNLGGHEFAVHLESNAVTRGDVWLYDAASGVAALGDLVTLPVPYLDTACPDGWKAALAHVVATPFRVAIPGHGAPMTVEQVGLYSRSFDAFIACAASSRTKEACGQEWASAIASLLTSIPGNRTQAEQGAAYYVQLLRDGHGRSKYCEA